MGEPCGTAKAVGNLAGTRCEVIGALPSHPRAEPRALGREPVVEWRAPERTHRFELVARPAHGVVQAECLDRALAEMCAVAMEAREASDIDIPHIDAGLAASHPFREQPPGTARVGDAGGVEPSGDEHASALR